MTNVSVTKFSEGEKNEQKSYTLDVSLIEASTYLGKEQINHPRYLEIFIDVLLQSYIHGSSQGQYVAETYIVMMLHGAIAVGFIVMNEACNQKGLDESQRKGRACS